MKYNLPNILAIYSFLPSRLKKRLFLLVPLLSVSGILEILSLASIMSLGSSMLNTSKSSYLAENLGYGGISHHSLILLISIGSLSLFLIKGLYTFFVTRYALDTASYSRSFFQQEIFSTYLRLPFLHHLSKNSSEFIRNITTECNSLDARFLTPIVVLLAEIFPVFFIVSFLFVINPLGLIVSSFMFLVSGTLIVRFSSNSLKYYGTKQMDSDGQLIKIAQQSFHCIKEIYLYKKQNVMVERLGDFANSSAQYISKGALLSQLPRFILEINALLAVFVIASLAVYSGSTVNQVIVQLGIYLAAVFKLLPSASKIVSHLQALNYSRPTVDNIVNQLRLPITKDISEELISTERLTEFKSLKIENLTFAYENSATLFSDISFNIQKGQVVGLIGETGAGKTTLVNILLRLIPFSNGKFLINDKDISSVGYDWSQMLAYVPQDIYMLDDTISNNICFYNENDSNEVNRVLTQVGMRDFVSGLPFGVNTNLGERGSRLSGGQKQRIGIARALYRNPEFLIFDEATSALDNQTEAAITESINNLRGDKTIIIIAHRLSSLTYCDKIIKLKGDGGVEEFTAEEFKSKYKL